LLAVAQGIGIPYGNQWPFYHLPIDWLIIITAVGTGIFLITLYTKSNRPSPIEHSNVKFSFERRMIHFDGPEKDLTASDL
jgi:hypothetical protein